MSSNRKITLTVRILLVLTVIVVGLGAGLYFFLPHYLESRVIPQLLAETGFSKSAFKIRHLGIYGTELGGLRIGPEQYPSLIVRSLHIDYTPKKLLQKQIDRITLSGIELYGEFKDGKFALGGTDFNQALTKLQSSRTSMPNPVLICLPSLSRNWRFEAPSSLSQPMMAHTGSPLTSSLPLGRRIIPM